MIIVHKDQRYEIQNLECVIIEQKNLFIIIVEEKQGHIFRYNSDSIKSFLGDVLNLNAQIEIMKERIIE